MSAADARTLVGHYALKDGEWSIVGDPVYKIYLSLKGGKTHPVGQKQPNAFGLYDMHGNVWEWTSTAGGENRVNRGGCWDHSARNCGSSYRYWDSPVNRNYFLGFRLCASGSADSAGASVGPRRGPAPDRTIGTKDGGKAHAGRSADAGRTPGRELK